MRPLPFDLSDVGPADDLDAILDVAVDVLRDYLPDAGSTRVERLARYVLRTLGGEPYVPELYECGDLPADIYASDDHIGMDVGDVALSPKQARSISVALLRAAEVVEGEN